MKPRIVSKNLLSFSALSLSLLASTAFGQLIEITEPNQENTQSVEQNSAEQVPQELRSNSEGLSTQPVSISTGMSPQVAPQAGITVPSASTGIGGNNPGNANTGGVQVQSVNVTALQDSSQNQNNHADALRRERMRRELENEQRLMQKIEQGRLEDEASREGLVNGFNSKTQVEETSSMPVIVGAPVYAMNTVSDSAGMSTSVRSRSSEALFRITPSAGYRWYRNSSFSQFNMENMFVMGIAIEGGFNKYVGIEGGFTYGRDQVENNRGFAGYTPVYPNSYSPGYANYGAQFGGYNIRTRDTFEFTGALKAGLPVEKVRPYGVAGVGYVRQKYNIDNAYTTVSANNIGWDRSTNHMLGIFGGGVDVEVAHNFSLGARFDYQAVINKRLTAMHTIYGDAKDRMKLTGNLQLTF